LAEPWGDHLTKHSTPLSLNLDDVVIWLSERLSWPTCPEDSQARIELTELRSLIEANQFRN
jgi:hypothetical protein